MRVVGTIPHPYVKITVFALNMRYSVKLEMGQVEQTYKIRQSDIITNLEDLSKLVDDELIEECISHFTDMHKSMKKAFERLRAQEEKSSSNTELPK